MMIRLPTTKDVTTYVLIAGFAIAVFSIYLAVFRKIKRRLPAADRGK